jgi:DNA-binding NarL/FixJ family response regulator
MTMPNMTGDRLALELASIRPDIPIILCTGFSERMNRDESAVMGIKGYPMKPVIRSELAGMVRDVLDRNDHSR